MLVPLHGHNLAPIWSQFGPNLVTTAICGEHIPSHGANKLLIYNGFLLVPVDGFEPPTHALRGYMAIYAELGRGKRERISDARRIIDESDTLTIAQVRKEAQRIRGQSASGRDFKSEREQKAALPTLQALIDGPYSKWAAKNLRTGNANANRLKSRFPDFLKLRLDKITPAKVANWVNGRDATPETINRDIATLRSVLGRAVKLIDALKANPLEGVELLKVDRKAQRVRALTHDEKQRLVATLSNRDDTKRAARASGNEWRAERGHEAPGDHREILRRADPGRCCQSGNRTTARRTVFAAMDINRPERKNAHRGGRYRQDFRDSRSAIEPGRAPDLARLVDATGTAEDGLVFSIDGAQIGSLKKSYHKVLADAGIERVNGKGQRVNWHSLRHTFGTLLGAANVDPTTLQRLMGHANLSTTERYLHTDEVRKRLAVEALEGLG